jgi:hypothetical protein
MLQNELIKAAREKCLAGYLIERGFTLKKEGDQYRVLNQKGLFVKGNIWFNHFLGIGGNTLDYLIKIEGISFRKAVKLLTKDVNIPLFLPKSAIQLPEKNSSNKRVFAYLSFTRKISENLILFLFKNNYLYESATTHNCVFLGFDNDNIVRYSMQRSTLSSSSLKFESKGSNKKFSFSLKGTSDELFVFESIIDLLSFLTLYDYKIGSFNFLSLAGTSDIALDCFVSSHNIKRITFCLDNDLAGKKAQCKLMKKFARSHLVINQLPNFKDWNEELLNI